MSAPSAPSRRTRTLSIEVDPRQVTAFLVVTALLVWPLLHPPYDLLTTAVLACQYLIVALSLVLLTGFVGQISLCQGTLVGVGAFVSALGIRHLHLHYPFSMLVGAAAGALTAAVIGVVALRVRGLFFAVATLIFAYVADQYLFLQSWLVPSTSGVSIQPETVGQRGTIPFLDLSDAHNFYYLILAAAIFAVFAVANIRDSRTGRAFAALRGSEVAAASLGVDVTRTKLLGFAVAGSLAGLAGSLDLVAQGTIAPGQFNFIQSLFFLSVVVVGGLRSIGGAITSSILFAVLVGEVFFRFPTLADYLDLISAVLLTGVLLFFRGGFGALPDRVRASRLGRRVTERWQALRAGDRAGAPAAADPGPDDAAADADIAADAVEADQGDPATDQPAEPAAGEEVSEPVDPDRLRARRVEAIAALGVLGEPAGEPDLDGRRAPVLLAADDITVRFGGLTAVDGASLQVGAGEIVGLIGPNGAGKTTMFNALLGLNNPQAGRVTLYDQDVSDWPVHRRAALGVGRTFQVLQLFADLDVFDNLLVATHLQNRTGIAGATFASPVARQRERQARARVSAVLALMELEAYAGRRVGDLPFGVLRLVEVARTLVTGAPLVCLDEPASGLDSAETERLIGWLQVLRDIGITLLVIEHDVDMVLRLCDHIYVLDQGRLIAHGTPAQIQRDATVIASYLGTATDADPAEPDADADADADGTAGEPAGEQPDGSADADAAPAGRRPVGAGS